MKTGGHIRKAWLHTWIHTLRYGPLSSF